MLRRKNTPERRVVHWKGLVISPAPWSYLTSVAQLPDGYAYHQTGSLRWLTSPDGEEYVLNDGLHHWVVPASMYRKP